MPNPKTETAPEERVEAELAELLGEYYRLAEPEMERERLSLAAIRALRVRQAARLVRRARRRHLPTRPVRRGRPPPDPRRCRAVHDRAPTCRDCPRAQLAASLTGAFLCNSHVETRERAPPALSLDVSRLGWSSSYSEGPEEPVCGLAVIVTSCSGERGFPEGQRSRRAGMLAIRVSAFSVARLLTALSLLGLRRRRAVFPVRLRLTRRPLALRFLLARFHRLCVLLGTRQRPELVRLPKPGARRLHARCR